MSFQMIRCAFCNEAYGESEVVASVLVLPKNHKVADRLYSCCPECVDKGFARQYFDGDNFIITIEGVKRLLSENKRLMAGLATDTAILEQALPVASDRDLSSKEEDADAMSGVPV